jgi:hypothetical protein
MFAPVVDDPITEFSNELSVADLVILEFDQWNRTDHPRVSPTTICWCDFDLPVR